MHVHKTELEIIIVGSIWNYKYAKLEWTLVTLLSYLKLYYAWVLLGSVETLKVETSVSWVYM